jgi:hypothetical protein
MISLKIFFSVSDILNKWPDVNNLALNCNKTHYIQFAMKTNIANNVIIKYNNNISISSTFCTKLLGFTADGAFLWQNHTDVLSTKLSRPCYVISNMNQHMSMSVSEAIACSLFRSLMSYGILSYSLTISLLQKKAIRTVLGYGNMVSWRNMVKELGILPLASR